MSRKNNAYIKLLSLILLSTSNKFSMTVLQFSSVLAASRNNWVGGDKVIASGSSIKSEQLLICNILKVYLAVKSFQFCPVLQDLVV